MKFRGEKIKYYAVRKGLQTGIFTTWDETSKQVSGFSGAEYKSFKSKSEAEGFLTGKQSIQGHQNSSKRQPKSSVAVNRPIELSFGDDIIVYTDGGSRSHGNRSGEHVKQGDKAAWAYLILIANPKQEVSDTGGEYGATNNRMEIMGLLKALTYLADHQLEEQPVSIVSDSKYVLDAVTKGWLSGWRRRGWKRSGGPLLNKELWQQIDALLQRFSNIRYHWTKGHASDEGNVFVDHLLNQTMDEMAPKETRSTDKVALPKLKVTHPEDQKTAPKPSHHIESKKRKIRLDSKSINPEKQAPEKLSSEVEKSVHDVEESLKQLGLFDDHKDQ
ncbi:MAG: ribonuclease H family protein [Lentilactobacillus hilgardii]|uniref:ribonuclease H family protein n=1 Tax=Lentilactobacillus hilgardii TaxID=1588 RepID=UPI0039E73FE0